MPASWAKAFLPTTALFGCTEKPGDGRDQLGGRGKMAATDRGFAAIKSPSSFQGHHNFFQGGIARSLADAVDSAFRLAGPGPNRG